MIFIQNAANLSDFDVRTSVQIHGYQKQKHQLAEETIVNMFSHTLTSRSLPMNPHASLSFILFPCLILAKDLWFVTAVTALINA